MSRSGRSLPLEQSFVRIDADWTAEEALEVLDGVFARQAIVHVAERDEDAFYRYAVEDLRECLREKQKEKVCGSLDLREREPMPTLAFRPTLVHAPSLLLQGKRIAGIAMPPKKLRDLAVPFDVGGAEAIPRVLVASAPPEVALGEEASLLVKITSDTSIPGSLPMMLASGDEIEVVVQASGGLAIHGVSEGKLVIDDSSETLPLRFKIAGRAIGDGKISVYAFKDGQAIGAVKVSIRVVQVVAETNPTESAEDMRVAVAAPDLSLLVLENRADRSYSMRLTASDPRYELNFKPYGPITLDIDVEQFFSEFFRDIEAILGSLDSAEEQLERLGRKGTYLFEKIVPEPLRAQLWGLRRRIRSMQIQSEEPWIPWELCKLSGLGEDDLIVEGGFLCEEFEVTRWLLGVPQRTEIASRKIGIVVPSGSGLPAAMAERDYMLGLGKGGRAVTEIRAKATDLRRELASGEYDGLHFSGHGGFLEGNADGSAIVLESGGRFKPEDLTGVVANLGRKRHPLVFLNACEVGRAGMSLVGMGGWAKAFLQAGAGAFIGPHWKIGDNAASIFAQTFYAELFDNHATIGKAAQEARAAIKRASDPTWLAYTVYAHPAARALPIE